MKRLISLLLIFLPYISCTIGLCQDPKIDVEVDGDINIIGFLQDSLVFSNSETIYPSLPEWEINRWQNFLIHMNANREVIWYALYGQQTFHNFDVVSDKEGNVYVGGLYNYDLPLDSSTSLYTTLVEYVLIKYDPNGNYVWHRNSEGTISNYEFNMDIDSSGNIYFAGLFNGQFSFRDSDTVDSPDVSTFVVKFDSSGIKPWITQIHGSSKWVFDCEAAESGDSYVVGHFSDKEPIYLGNDTLHSKSEYDGYVAKFSTEGDPIFLKQITSLGRHAIPSSITAKNNGEFTVIGEFTRGLEFSNLPPMITNTDDKRLFIVNHDSLNNERWALYTSGHIYSSQRTKIAMDTEDNIYLTGDFADNPCELNDIPVEGSDRRLIKIDPTGNIVATNYIENGADADIFYRPQRQHLLIWNFQEQYKS